jgi:hypothetical protein
VSLQPGTNALKEWASVVSALAAGDQIVLVRKGGIAEKRFGLEADRFYLYPTFLHQEENQFKPSLRHHLDVTRIGPAEPESVEITAWCEAVQSFEVSELDALLRLEPFVIFTGQTIEDRYRFRPRQAMNVIAVRTFLLPHPVRVHTRAEYLGCRSWLALEEAIETDGSRAVLSDRALIERVAEIAAALQTSGARR